MRDFVFFVSVGGGRDMGDSRSGRLDVLTICKMRRADYVICSGNMGVRGPWAHGAFSANNFSGVFMPVKKCDDFASCRCNPKGYVVQMITIYNLLKIIL